MRTIPQRNIEDLDVQICFAGAPLLPSITNEILFRIINLPQTDCRLSPLFVKNIFEIYSNNQIPVCKELVWTLKIKNAFGLIHPQAPQVLKFGNLAVLAPTALDPRFCAAIFR
jgi:hypothetical protein